MSFPSKGYIEGQHDGIKRAIKEIHELRLKAQALGYAVSPQLDCLENELGVLIYKNWRPLRNNMAPCLCDVDAKEKAWMYDQLCK